MTANCKGCIYKINPKTAFTPHYCTFWERRITDKNPTCSAYDNTTKQARTAGII